MRGARRRATLLVALALALLVGAGPARAAPARSTAEHRDPSRSPGPHVLARSWALIDARSGDVLTAHDGARELPIASTTKLMTAWVVLQKVPLDKVVRAQPYEAEYGESLMGLRAGEKISVRDLLYGLVMRSGNDAAHTLALATSGSQRGFVAEMNRYAAALGLADTHYANPIGLDQRGNYSSALDLATLTRRLLDVDAFAKVAAARSHELDSVQPPRRLTSINELLRMAPWVTGVKTGHTFGAEYMLVGSGSRHGVPLIAVSVGAPTDEARYTDDFELLEYGFSLYRHRTAVGRGDDLAEPAIRWAGGALPLRAARRLRVGLRRGQRLDVEVSAPARVEGPIARGTVLGHAVVTVDGLPAGAVPLVASRGIPPASTFDRLRGFVDEHWILIGVGAFVILLGLLLLGRGIAALGARLEGSR